MAEAKTPTNNTKKGNQAKTIRADIVDIVKFSFKNLFMEVHGSCSIFTENLFVHRVMRDSKVRFYRTRDLIARAESVSSLIKRL